jgi:hypothetical protein
MSGIRQKQPVELRQLSVRYGVGCRHLDGRTASSLTYERIFP